MKLITNINQMRVHQNQVRQLGKTVAMVPTMGSIHQAHLELVRHAVQAADQVVVCIMPLPGPVGTTAGWKPYNLADLTTDLSTLSQKGVSLVFAPSNAELYPRGVANHCRIRLSGVTDRLCALKREGALGYLYYQYVPAQLIKLFNIVDPTHLVMGVKAYQQMMLMQRVIQDFEFQIQLIRVPTVRDHTGLALASRNRYMSQTQREQASQIYQCISNTIAALKQGDTDIQKLESDAVASLTQPDIQMSEPDVYFSILDANTLQPVTIQPGPRTQPMELVVMCAVWVGTTRVVDAELVTLTA